MIYSHLIMIMIMIMIMIVIMIVVVIMTVIMISRHLAELEEDGLKRACAVLSEKL